MSVHRHGGVWLCPCSQLGILRFVLTDCSNPGNAEEEPLRILVKVNAIPKVRLELDQMVRLTNCEVRRALVKQDNSLPEAYLVTNLCGLELGANLPTPKRRRGQSDAGGWLGDRHDLEVVSLIPTHPMRYLARGVGDRYMQEACKHMQ